MKLINVEMIPGVVINPNDDQFLGRVKCSAPGLFDPSVMPEETLPWIYPISMCGFQRFSKLQKGSKVWIIKNPVTYNEYWYITFVEFKEYTKNFLKEYYDNDLEIIMMRESGPINAYITYDNVNGFKINIGDNSFLNINNSIIELTNNKATVKLEGDIIYIGNKEEEYEPITKAISLKKILSQLSSNMQQLQQKALANPYTTGLATGFADAAKTLSSLDSILAKNSKVN